MSRMDDGFPTTILLSGNTSLLLYEKEVIPPPVSMGGPIETTTMYNTEYRTFSPKALKQTGNTSIVAAFDPAVFDEIVALTNINQRIEITFPDNLILQFYGVITDFNINPIEEGRQPTALMQMISTNVDDWDAEVPPVTLVTGDYGIGLYGVGLYLG